MRMNFILLALSFIPVLASLHAAAGAAAMSSEPEGFFFPRDGFRGASPGAPTIRAEGDRLVMENDLLQFQWHLGEGCLRPLSVTDRRAGITVDFEDEELFRIVFEGGEEVACSDLRCTDKPELADLVPHEESPRYAGRLEGKEIRLVLNDEKRGVRAAWRAILRDGSNYIRQEVTLTLSGRDDPLREVIPVDLPLPGASVRGRVDGSPIVAGTFFVAMEHPMARCAVESGKARCRLERPASAGRDETLSFRSVTGVTIPGQTRRSFLFYLERERAHPYRQFLHYNSWYDIAWPGHLMNETLCLDVIERFGRNLVEKRGVPMQSFVFDDGWDDHTTLWEFHEGFPSGFSPLAEAAAAFESRIGTWISPWGGYGAEKQARIAYGRSRGFETNNGGFSLAGPQYNRRFTDVCRNFMEEFECSYFKFDGIGGGTYARGAPREATLDLEALLGLCDELRSRDPDLFINATVGTWPSPWWLFSVDSIWRQGEDIGFSGEAGSMRDRWITYRDSLVHRRIVRNGPFFPLNSLMFHGLALARLGTPTRMNNDCDAFRRDVRDFFATGTGLQELYITASMLTEKHWDIVAEAARWARANENVLVDSHWVGGDPGCGEVYGFASWSPRKAVLMLRNPLDEGQTFSLDAGAVFELPDGTPSQWILRRPWKDGAAAAITVQAGKCSPVKLKPLEVAVWDATPVARSEPYAYTGYEEAGTGFRGPREKYLGRWEYRYAGKKYEREFRRDGTAHLYIDGAPYSGWNGFTWSWEDGTVAVKRGDGVIDGEHGLKGDDTLLFLTDPFGPARRVKKTTDRQ